MIIGAYGRDSDRLAVEMAVSTLPKGSKVLLLSAAWGISKRLLQDLAKEHGAKIQHNLTHLGVIHAEINGVEFTARSVPVDLDKLRGRRYDLVIFLDEFSIGREVVRELLSVVPGSSYEEVYSKKD